MLPPVRCFGCNHVLPWSRIDERRARGEDLAAAMTAEGLPRACCRRMVVCQPAGLEDILLAQRVKDVSFVSYAMQMRSAVVRTVASD